MNAISGQLYQPARQHQHLQASSSLTTGGSSASSASPTDSNSSNNGAAKYHTSLHHNHIQQHPLGTTLIGADHYQQQQQQQPQPSAGNLIGGLAYGQASGAQAGQTGNQLQHHHQQAGGQQQQQHHHHHSHHHHQQQHHQQQQQQHHHQQQQQRLPQYGCHQTIDSTTLGSSHGQSKKSLDKGSDEYKKRRERNNVAVRKSREKAKLRSRETERRVAELSKENQLYRAQYEELRREFNVLKSLLLKTGLTEQVIEDEAQRQTMQQQISQTSSNAHNHMLVASNHHLVSSLNNHAALKGANCNPIPSANNQAHYTATAIEPIDQWTDGIGTYVDDTY